MLKKLRDLILNANQQGSLLCHHIAIFEEMFFLKNVNISLNSLNFYIKYIIFQDYFNNITVFCLHFE